MGPRKRNSGLPSYLILIAILVVLVGGGVWLANVDSTKPLKTIEKTVPANALAG